jgi:hypothetical protein
MWLTLRILGVEIFDLTVGFADRGEDSESESIISQNGGAFEIAGEAEPEWEPSEDWEYADDAACKLGRRPPFGFMHA